MLVNGPVQRESFVAAPGRWRAASETYRFDAEALDAVTSATSDMLATIVESVVGTP